MVLEKWLTKNVNKTVESVVEPAKKIIKEKAAQAGTQTDLATKLVLLGAAIFMVWSTFKQGDASDSAIMLPKAEEQPHTSHIVINNYVSHVKEDNNNDN